MAVESREYDKSSWGDGPWRHEPDRLEFEHAGLPCLMLRNDSGVWCGYVAVPPGHPWHGKQYSQCVEGCAPDPVIEDIDERYPITDEMPAHSREFTLSMRALARKADETPGRFMSTQWLKEHPRWSCYDHTVQLLVQVHGGLTFSGPCTGSICHDPAPGEPVDVWWFGFDCGHAGDVMPQFRHLGSMRDAEYRDQAYVKAEVENLAAQLARRWPPPAKATRRISLEE